MPFATCSVPEKACVTVLISAAICSKGPLISKSPSVALSWAHYWHLSDSEHWLHKRNMLNRDSLRTISKRIDVFHWACIACSTIAAISSIISLLSTAINPTVSVVEMFPNFTQSISTGGEDHVQVNCRSYRPTKFSYEVNPSDSIRWVSGRYSILFVPSPSLITFHLKGLIVSKATAVGIRAITYARAWLLISHVAPGVRKLTSFLMQVSNFCFLGFGYKLQVKNANDTASDARTVDLVASAILHTLSMSSIYLVHGTAAERALKWLLLCLYPLYYNGLEYRIST